MDEEEIVRQFFKEMKDADSNLTVPDYQSKAESNKWFLIGGIAAVIVLAITFNWIFFNDPKPISTIEIVVDIPNSMQTKSLMTTDISIEEWQPPTQSLIDDF
ncbi:hypothetical protein [Fulvivirga sp.]|uniref:hypothetical protein n=1 Tax=Fulvivirga sp. TaxID=1931237 RepID=UPI0032EF9D1C